MCTSQRTCQKRKGRDSGGCEKNGRKKRKIHTRYFSVRSYRENSSAKESLKEPSRGTREICKVREHIKCLYTNIDGINALKGAELKAVVDEVEPHVVFLTETKLLKDMVISQYLDCTNFSVLEETEDKDGEAV